MMGAKFCIKDQDFGKMFISLENIFKQAKEEDIIQNGQNLRSHLPLPPSRPGQLYFHNNFITIQLNPDVETS
jgi:hypothetical protein